jgi:hypothetical protein
MTDAEACRLGALAIEAMLRVADATHIEQQSNRPKLQEAQRLLEVRSRA